MSNRSVLHLRSSGAMLGAESVILDLATQSREMGVAPVIGVLHDVAHEMPELATRARDVGLEVQIFPVNSKYDVGTVLRLRRYLESREFSLLHTHGYREDLVALAARSHLPLVATNHLWKLTSTRLRALAEIDALALRQFDSVVAVSGEIAEDMRRRGVAPAKIRVIHNGVRENLLTSVLGSEERASIRRGFGYDESHFVVIMLSSLTPEKGHKIALDAFAHVRQRLPLARLLIVGSGPEEVPLRSYARQLGVADIVHFAGWQSNPAPMLQSADAYVLASTQEGLPIALLEAMALGVPVTATAVGEVPHVLAEQPECLARPRSADDIAARLTVLATDGGLRTRLAAALKETVRNRFTARAMTVRYLETYALVDSQRTQVRQRQS